LSEKASCKLQLTTFYAFHANHEQYLQNRSWKKLTGGLNCMRWVPTDCDIILCIWLINDIEFVIHVKIHFQRPMTSTSLWGI
jgi:hypothetical protein